MAKKVKRGPREWSPRRRKKDQFVFSELDEAYQEAIIERVGQKAGKTVWEFVPDFPVDLAAGVAWDNSILVFDRDIESLMTRIEGEGNLRPILFDEMDEENIWMQGRYIALASEKLGLKTLPALYRIK